MKNVKYFVMAAVLLLLAACGQLTPEPVTPDGGLAVLDILYVDSLGTTSATVNLGTINPGKTAAHTANLYVKCDKTKHANLGTMPFTVASPNTEVSTTTSLTIPKSGANAWPADGANCASPNPQVANGSLGINVSVPAGATLGARSVKLTVTSDDADLNGANGKVDVTVNYTVAAPAPSDTTPPAVNITLPNPGGTGWFTSSVTGSVSANDPSNVADITCTGATVGTKTGLGTGTASAPLTVSAEGVSAITCTAKDGANNTGAATGSVNTGTVKIDTVAPTVTPANVANTAWRNSSLAQAFTASDAGSGLAVAEDASFTLTASAESANASTPTSESKTVADVAGNTTTRSVSALIDKTAPVVTVAGVADGDSYAYGSVPTVTCSTTDALSGVDKEATLGSSGGPTGSVTYSCNGASDNAGNSASASATVTVTKVDQEISFGTLADKTYGDAPFEVSATGGASGKPVKVTASGKCSVEVATVSLSGVGTCTLTASQESNDTYNAAQPVAQSFNIAKATATVTVTDYSGVYDGKAHGVSGSAQGVNNEDLTSLLDLGDKHTNAGSYSVAWTFAGSDNYKSASGDATIAIAKAAASVSLSDLNHAYDGATKAATAGTTPENLKVVLSYSATPVNAGSYDVTATVDDANYEGSASATLNIAKADQVLSWSTPAAITYGTALEGAQLDASLTMGNGVLNYSPVAGTKLGAGTHTLKVDAAATDNYNASSTTVQIVVTKVDATVHVDGFSGSYDGQAHGASGTATGVDKEDLGNLLSLGETFTDVPGGTANWTFKGGTNYNGASGSVEVVITKATTNTTVTCAGTPTYTGSAQTPCSATATGAGGLSETVAVSYSNNVSAGTASASANHAGGQNHEASNGSATFTIGKAATTTTVTIVGSSFVYTGSAQTPATVTVTGVGNLNLAPTATYANHVNAGTATASYTYAGDNNYLGSSDSKTFTIGKANAVMTVQGYTGVYDGQAHGASGSATGVMSEPLSGLNLGTTFTNVPGGTANWTFAGGTNYNNASGSVDITIAAWTLQGFYQPVGEANTLKNSTANTGSVYNSIKGGSTVPLKFNVFRGGNKSASVADIKGFNAAKVSCLSSSPSDPVEAEFITTGSTSLRYDAAEGQFIQNWKTPAVSGTTCYRVTVTTLDGSSLVTFFSLRK